MTKEDFCKSLRAIQEYENELNNLEGIFQCSLIDANITRASFNIINHLINALAGYDEQVIDDINWWLYDSADKVWDIGDKTIPVETPEQLYDALHKLLFI